MITPEATKLRRPRVMPDVVRALAGDILSGRFAPGAMLPREPDLCVDYGVSRTVIREALKTLDAKGLVVTRSRVGTQVADPERWNILDPQIIEWHPEGTLDNRLFDSILETRRGIEPLVAELAAKRASLAEIGAIDAAFREMQAAGGDIDHFSRADIIFHRELYAASHNPVFRQIGKLIDAALTFALQATAILSPDERAEAIRVHGAVVDALRLRDGKAARLAAEAILDLAARDLAMAHKMDAL
ncbi:FadR/GntR family transcriptional regulator [Pseudorhodobacter sp.]|uniref:FadR/GntR family transcriptional regulator n=1 Tax=Pseudorhodobacter sp. TaxID=1934400 RepID=UPI002649AEE7|nr:FadR/GntR family transcriptional regulator [Pseudorhodobacter sp.]MDN5788019.1 FadR family transcriptional regulator [Pseudorhodobacter sp.]